MSDIRTPRRWPTAIVWFRRDLRVHDHPALLDAVEHADHVYPPIVDHAQARARALDAFRS